MDRRIFGLENEYGVTCTFRGQRRLSPDEVARYLFRRVVSWGRSSNVFLENGARLYLDVGSHPEYATPECDDIRQLVAHDKAGASLGEALRIGVDALGEVDKREVPAKNLEVAVLDRSRERRKFRRLTERELAELLGSTARGAGSSNGSSPGSGPETGPPSGPETVPPAEPGPPGET